MSKYKMNNKGKYTYDQGVKKADEIIGDGFGDLESKGSTKKTRAEYETLKLKSERQSERAAAQMSRAQNISSRFEKMADQGMSPEAREAFRTKMAKQMSKEGNIAGLKAGASMGGMKGASAAAQQRSLMAQAMMGRANIERDVFIENENKKQAGLQGLSQAFANENSALAGIQNALTGEQNVIKGSSDFEKQIETFDIGQRNAEKELRANIGLQYEQIAQADRAAEIAAQAQVDAAEAGKSCGLLDFSC